MNDKSDISSEKNLHRWLLTATLLLSFFSFSGFVGNVSQQKQQITHTELVVKTHSVVKKATHFCGAFKKFPASIVSALFPKLEIKYVLIVHSLLNKAKFDIVSAHIFTFPQPQKFFCIRKVYQSSEDDFSYLFRG